MTNSVDAAVAAFAAEHLADGAGATVACSGGADSLALALSVLRAIGPDRARAATVDHQLQAGSAAQAETTASQLREFGYREVDVRTVQVGVEGGPEAAARTARYRALAPVDETAVLLGHTLDDQAETVLLGLARGSGPRSVAGMAAWRRPWGRPLLGVRRSETENYCRAAGVTWWSDPHNVDAAFTRVRLRREVLPLLEEVLGGGVAPALARTAAMMTEDLQALDLFAAQVLAQAMTPEGVLALAVIRDHPVAVRRRVLRAWVSAVGARPVTSEHLRKLDAIVVGPTGNGSAVRLPGAWDAVRQGDLLVARQV